MHNIPKSDPLPSQANTTPEIISIPSQTSVSGVSNIMPKLVNVTGMFKKISNIMNNVENKEQHNNQNLAINPEINKGTTNIQQSDNAVESQAEHKDRPLTYSEVHELFGPQPY